jgi:alkanesulfonate monooxygenase SsuD/methylene tetrahydromethanopterin reductase-like flavin-dependent oxidoreductase (luciferase family)
VLIGEDRAEACELARRAVEQHVGQSFGSHFLAKDATVRPELRALAQSADGVQVERLIEEGRLLAGTPKDCVGQVERVRRETGLDCINCAFSWGGLDDETAMRSMRLFAQEVIPLVRAHEAAAR